MRNAQHDWVDWPFRYKPCSLDGWLPVCGTHMPGVDWQAWFLGLRHDRSEPPDWLERLMQMLLVRDEDVCALFGPLPLAQPTQMRCALYDYRYARQGRCSVLARS